MFTGIVVRIKACAPRQVNQSPPEAPTLRQGHRRSPDVLGVGDVLVISCACPRTPERYARGIPLGFTHEGIGARIPDSSERQDPMIIGRVAAKSAGDDAGGPAGASGLVWQVG